jgi:hypothetical protein
MQFNESMEVKAPNSFFKFDVVGTWFAAIYRGAEERPNKMDMKGEEPMQLVHEFEMIKHGGSEANKFVERDRVLFAKTGKPGKIVNAALKDIAFGQVVGLEFAEEMKNKMNPQLPAAKIIKVYNLSQDPKYAEYVNRKTEQDVIVESAMKDLPF